MARANIHQQASQMQQTRAGLADHFTLQYLSMLGVPLLHKDIDMSELRYLINPAQLINYAAPGPVPNKTSGQGLKERHPVNFFASTLLLCFSVLNVV
eukprot:1159379-Pelagomonas_calceolata.AAC.2